MADAKPLKLVDAGGGAGELREFEASDAVPVSAGGTGSGSADQALENLGGSATGIAVFKGGQSQGRASLGLGTAALEAVGTSGNSVAKLNANNTWSGQQTYTGSVLTGQSLFVGRGAPTSTNVILSLGFSTASTAADIYSYTSGDGVTVTGRMRTIGGTNSNSYSGATDIYTSSFRPIDDGLTNLGIGSRRWNTLYASTGTINTSDEREKTPVRKLTEAELRWAVALSDEIGAYMWLSAIAEKGDYARDHIGMTVQRAIQLGEAEGLEPHNYGFICYDQWAPRTEVMVPAQTERVEHAAELNEDGEVIKEAWVEEVVISEEVTQFFPGGDRYSFRETELLSFIISGLAERSKKDRARLDALEQALNITN